MTLVEREWGRNPAAARRVGGAGGLGFGDRRCGGHELNAQVVLQHLPDLAFLERLAQQVVA